MIRIAIAAPFVILFLASLGLVLIGVDVLSGGHNPVLHSVRLKVWIWVSVLVDKSPAWMKPVYYFIYNVFAFIYLVFTTFFLMVYLIIALSFFVPYGLIFFVCRVVRNSWYIGFTAYFARLRARLDHWCKNDGDDAYEHGFWLTADLPLLAYVMLVLHPRHLFAYDEWTDLTVKFLELVDECYDHAFFYRLPPNFADDMIYTSSVQYTRVHRLVKFIFVDSLNIIALCSKVFGYIVTFLLFLVGLVGIMPFTIYNYGFGFYNDFVNQRAAARMRAQLDADAAAAAADTVRLATQVPPESE